VGDVSDICKTQVRRMGPVSLCAEGYYRNFTEIQESKLPRKTLLQVVF